MLVGSGLMDWWTAYRSCLAASHLAWCPSQDACSAACLTWAVGVCWCMMGAESLWAILGWARALVSSMYNPQREYILIAKRTKYTSYLSFTLFYLLPCLHFLFIQCFHYIRHGLSPGGTVPHRMQCIEVASVDSPLV